jgi:hypothetical protein
VIALIRVVLLKQLPGDETIQPFKDALLPLNLELDMDEPLLPLAAVRTATGTNHLSDETPAKVVSD